MWQFFKEYDVQAIRQTVSSKNDNEKSKDQEKGNFIICSSMTSKLDNEE